MTMARGFSVLFTLTLALAAGSGVGCGNRAGQPTPPATTAVLSVAASGSGSGRIASSPSGIDCGASCSASFALGASVTLTAVPDAGSTFDGWSGDCPGGGPGTRVTMTAARSCVATFTAQRFALTVASAGNGSGRVTSSPSGIDCGSSCTAMFAAASSATLTAAPAAGSLFAGWSGDCSGADPTATVTMSAARSCTARFVLQVFALTVASAGDGLGNITSSPAGIDCVACSADFLPGTSVTLTASPAIGSIFSGWSGDCIGSSPSATVTLSATRLCTASFTLKNFALTVSRAGTGSGNVRTVPAAIDCGATCSASLPVRLPVTLVATPAPGSIFSAWSGDCAGAAPGATLTMNAAHACTASFSPGVARAPFPQMPVHAGPLLPRLQLVTVTFAGYPFRSFVESFGDFVVGSQWLAAVTRGYGAFAASHLGKVVLPASACCNYPSIITSGIQSGTLPYPSDASGLLYLFYTPAPCSTAGGYHSTVSYNGKTIAYGVSNNCSDGKAAEGVASHEIGEVITDPYLDGMYFDAGSAPWVGEVGDICNSAPWWMEGGFRLEPIWSNVDAAAGGTPCVPWLADHVYFNVSPSTTTPQTVAAGSSASWTLTGWSTAATGSWTLSADADGYAPQGFDATPTLSPSTISSGTTAQLTLHVPAATPSGSRATVRVHSHLPDVVDGVTGFAADWSFQVIAQ